MLCRATNRQLSMLLTKETIDVYALGGTLFIMLTSEIPTPALKLTHKGTYNKKLKKYAIKIRNPPSGRQIQNSENARTGRLWHHLSGRATHARTKSVYKGVFLQGVL